MVDDVVDVHWNLVPFRSMVLEGAAVIAVPATGGVEVSIRGLAAELSGEGRWSPGPQCAQPSLPDVRPPRPSSAGRETWT